MPSPARGYDGCVQRGPELVVIGVLKCGTSAMHAYLDAHPGIAMAPGKELNFFFGPDEAPPTPPDTWWRTGTARAR